jgi:hypothetical protein
MGACETTPPTARPRTPRPLNPPSTSSPPPIIGCPLAGVQLVRPRRCAAPGAPARTPDQAAAANTQLSGKSHIAVSPARQPHASHRARTPRLLTKRVPMGAETSMRPVGGGIATALGEQITAEGRRRAGPPTGAEPGHAHRLVAPADGAERLIPGGQAALRSPGRGTVPRLLSLGQLAQPEVTRGDQDPYRAAGVGL